MRIDYRRVSRGGLKLPKIIPNAESAVTEEEYLKIARSVKLGLKAKRIKTVKFKAHPGVTMVNREAHQLVVVTRAKNLTAYVMTVTEKSPKRFRFTFVNRLQNYCLDVLENLIRANSLRMDNPRNRALRKEYQHEAYVKLNLLCYVAFISYQNECILKKQFEQISLQATDCKNLLVAWTKSDLKKGSSL